MIQLSYITKWQRYTRIIIETLHYRGTLQLNHTAHMHGWSVWNPICISDANIFYVFRSISSPVRWSLPHAHKKRHNRDHCCESVWATFNTYTFMLLSSTISKLIILCNSIFSTLPLGIIIVINVHNLYSHFHLYNYTMKLKLTFYHSKDSGTEEDIIHIFMPCSLIYLLLWIVSVLAHTLSLIPLSIPSLLFWKRNKERWI